MIYTSNYARQGSHPNAIAISRKPPDWYQGVVALEVAPTWELIYGLKDGTITKSFYASEYHRLLKQRKVDPFKFIAEIQKRNGDAFLLCYENPTDFCHRHILAAWLMYETDVVIQEWKNERELREEKQQENVDSLLDF